MNSVSPGVYLHYKGNHYEVVSVAKHSETLEDMVVYKALYGERGTWVRPLSMWENPIEIGGKTVRRFERVGDNTAEADADELSEALRSINSTCAKCEKAIHKLREETPQHTLTERRIKALWIAAGLMERELGAAVDVKAKGAKPAKEKTTAIPDRCKSYGDENANCQAGS